MIGIYCYQDTLNDNEIVYVGKDSNIDRNVRYKAHLKPSQYNHQQINRVIQNNPGRYKYTVLKKWKRDEYNPNLANALEILYIRRYKPLFNFTIGGEGLLGVPNGMKGKHHSIETRKKISDANKGKVFSEERKKKMSEERMGVNNPFYGKTHSEEHKQRMSELMTGESNHQYKDYFRIIKQGIRRNKQQYCIYKDGKVIKTSVYPDRLLKWFKENYPDEELKELHNQ